MKRIMFSLIMTLILVCLMSGVGLTATWYVDGDKSTSGDGTSWEEAVKTIQEAIDVSGEGDEIWVERGTYFLLSQINVNTAVHIYAGFAGWETQRDERDWAANVTTVDGQYAVRCFYMTADATIDGFTITQGREEGGGSGGGICSWDSSPTIANCTISHNTATYPGGGISCHGSASATITNCVISGNLAWNGGGIYNDSSSPTITNCILWGDEAEEGQEKEIYDDEFSSPTVTYCDIEGGYTGDGNMDSDPLFRDSGNGDFHLHNGSPCIDSGNNEAPDLPVTDFEGDTRIYDGDNDGTATVDVGADEVVLRAGFSADVTSGNTPLTAQFTDQSTGSIDTWEWDFDNDGTVDSTAQNPAPWTYTEAGDFTVSLTVTGPGGSDTETRTDYIHVTTQSICQCNLVPDDIPTVIPRGGTLGFQANITNNTGGMGTVLFGTKLTKPDASQTGFIWGPFEIWLNPYQTKSGHKTHTIPSGFELGTYTYHGYVGKYGDIYDECQFDFEVVP